MLDNLLNPSWCILSTEENKLFQEIAWEKLLGKLSAVTQWVKIINNGCYTHFCCLTSTGEKKKKKKAEVFGKKTEVDLNLKIGIVFCDGG